MNFGKFNKIIIFGGGENANYFASICKEKEIEVISIVHPRHYNQVLEDKKNFFLLYLNTLKFIKLVH